MSSDGDMPDPAGAHADGAQEDMSSPNGSPSATPSTAIPPIVKIVKNHAFVAPGQAERVPLTVRNVSGIVESFSLTVLGPAATWGEVIPSEVSLFPGDEESATLTVRPPRVPGVVAGEYTVAVRALSQVSRESAATDEILVTVAPFYQTTTEIARSTFTVRTKAETTIEIVNRGNATVEYHLSAVDPEAYMSVTLEETKVTLAPGETTWVLLKMKMAPRIFGTANDNRMVTAQIVPVRNADTDAAIMDIEPQLQRVTVLHKPFITLRMSGFARLIFLITILALIAAFVFARIRANTPPENAGAPPVPVNFTATLNELQQPVLTWNPSSGATNYSIYAIGAAGDPMSSSSPAASGSPSLTETTGGGAPSVTSSPLSAVDAPERPSPVCDNCSEVTSLSAGTTRFVVTNAPPGYDCYRIAAKVGTTQSLFSPRTCIVVPGANILADASGKPILTPSRQLQTMSAPPSPTPSQTTVWAPCPPINVSAQAIPGGGIALLWNKPDTPPKGMVGPSALASPTAQAQPAPSDKALEPEKICDPAKAITGWTAQQQLFSGWSDVSPTAQPNDTALQIANLQPGTQYCFRMRTNSADAESVYSKIACAKTTGSASPASGPAPAGVPTAPSVTTTPSSGAAASTPAG